MQQQDRIYAEIMQIVLPKYANYCQKRSRSRRKRAQQKIVVEIKRVIFQLSSFDCVVWEFVFRVSPLRDKINWRTGLSEKINSSKSTKQLGKNTIEIHR